MRMTGRCLARLCRMTLQSKLSAVLQDSQAASQQFCLHAGRAESRGNLHFPGSLACLCSMQMNLLPWSRRSCRKPGSQCMYACRLSLKLRVLHLPTKIGNGMPLGEAPASGALKMGRKEFTVLM